MSQPEDSDDLITVYHHLTSKAQDLITDLTEFQNFARSNSKDSTEICISANKFHNDIQREAELLKKYGVNLPKPRIEKSKWPVSTAAQTGSQLHQIRSSNIGHLDLVWQDAKQARGVVGIRRQVRYSYGGHVEFDDVSSKQNLHARQRSRQLQMQQIQQYQCFQQGFQPVGYQHGYQHGYQVQYSQQVRGGQHGYSNGQNVNRRPDKEHVVVDVISDHGRKWIKLFTKTQRWLALDLAKEGVIDLSCDSDDDQASGSDGSSERMYNDKDKAILEDLKLVKMAREFLAASKTARVGYRHPIVLFHMPKISRGEDKDIDIVLSYLCHIGIVVRDATDLAERAAKKSQDVYQNGPLIVHSDDNEEDEFWGSKDEVFETDLTKCFERMLSSPPLENLTETVNIDCTVLIALVSDISHRRRHEIAVPAHYNGREAKKDIEMQIKSEETDSLLTKHIYPLLRGKKLVCTAKAAAHLRNIVQVMGSQGETKRSNILLQYPSMTWRSSVQAQQQLQEVSSHPVLHDLQLPIDVIEGDSAYPRGGVDAEVMDMVANHPRLSPLNRSVFFHGWKNEITTITMNRIVSEWLTRTIDRNLDEVERRERCFDISIERRFRGPAIVTCGRERSLLGNDKQ